MKNIALFYLSFLISSNLLGQKLNFNNENSSLDTINNSYFGHSVCISDNYAIVGAKNNCLDENGGHYLNGSGAAYIFKKENEKWNQVQKLVANDREEGMCFGFSVQIVGDYALVGADWANYDDKENNFLLHSGAVYFFKNISGTWQQIQKLVPKDRSENDFFGHSLAMSDNFIFIGAPGKPIKINDSTYKKNAGAVYVFELRNEIWQQTEKLESSDLEEGDLFGRSVSVSGTTVVVGATGNSTDIWGRNPINWAGAAYVFSNSNGKWVQTQKLVANDRNGYDWFGCSIEISKNFIVVGSCMDDDDNSYNNEVPDAGSVYIFMKQGDYWYQNQKINDKIRMYGSRFGYSVSLSNGTLLVGSNGSDYDTLGQNWVHNAGSVSVFERINNKWIQTQTLTATERQVKEYFGCSVFIENENAIIGAMGKNKVINDTVELQNVGSIYSYNVKNISSIRPLASVDKGFKVYPNPISDFLFIESQCDNFSFIIFNQSGLILTQGRNEKRIDISTLKKGIYFIQIDNGPQLFTEKIIKI